MLQVSGLHLHFQSHLETSHVGAVDIPVLPAIICMCSHFHSEGEEGAENLSNKAPVLALRVCTGNNYTFIFNSIQLPGENVLAQQVGVFLLVVWVFFLAGLI